VKPRNGRVIDAMQENARDEIGPGAAQIAFG
jgi:hypothetical protein